MQVSFFFWTCQANLSESIEISKQKYDRNRGKKIVLEIHLRTEKLKHKMRKKKIIIIVIKFLFLRDA